MICKNHKNEITCGNLRKKKVAICIFGKQWTKNQTLFILAIINLTHKTLNVFSLSWVLGWIEKSFYNLSETCWEYDKSAFAQRIIVMYGSLNIYYCFRLSTIQKTHFSLLWFYLYDYSYLYFLLDTVLYLP